MVKQVIVVRTDIPIPIGRIPSQVAHASIKNILDRGHWNGDTFTISNVPKNVKEWMKNDPTKVVLKVWGEKEILNLANKAKEEGVSYTIWKDDNVNPKKRNDRVITAISIGPDQKDKIDEVTGKLNLL